MVCMFEDELSSKRVYIHNAEKLVAADMQCRSCYSPNDPTSVTDLQRNLLQHHCIAESDTCRYSTYMCIAL